MNDQDAIRQVVRTWLAATEAGDYAAVLELMSDDVVFLTPGQPPFGKAEFKARQAAMKDADIRTESEIQEINVFGSWAYCWNKLAVSVRGAEGSAFHAAGHALSILSKRNGRWVIVRDANLLVENPD